ncbi:DinB family protein [Bacillus dakarensis]|uniref:DinB family protein n=1 Tax=Robertmurraya dakarensis TaxID=1926278 RepID=UPI000980F59D|nr:DinB family protein [Bacillus dakarensis]
MSETISMSTQTILNRWSVHRDVLFELVKVFPESSANFRPTPKVMSVVEMIHHLAWVPDFFFSAMEGREWKVPPVPQTLAEARELLEELTIEHRAVISRFTEEDLQREATIHVFNKTEPIAEMLQRMITHEAHHKGQLILYARLLELEPPFYTIY